MAGPLDGDYLLYDGECPVCSQYILWTTFRQDHPGIRLLDARSQPEMVAALRAEGIVVNDTFVLQVDGQRHIGPAAMAQISRRMQGHTLWQRILRGLTTSERLMRPVYPLLVRLRKLLLAVMGRPQLK